MQMKCTNDNCPPSQDALLQHIHRAVLQSNRHSCCITLEEAELGVVGRWQWWVVSDLDHIAKSFANVKRVETLHLQKGQCCSPTYAPAALHLKKQNWGWLADDSSDCTQFGPHCQKSHNHKKIWNIIHVKSYVPMINVHAKHTIFHVQTYVVVRDNVKTRRNKWKLLILVRDLCFLFRNTCYALNM